MPTTYAILLGLVLGFMVGLTAVRYPSPQSYQFRWNDYEYMRPEAYAKLGYSFPSAIHVH